MCRKMKLDHLLILHIRINSKWIKDLNVKLEPIESLQENINSKISDIALSKFLLDISPQARKTKQKNKQMGLHQTKKLTARETIIMKREPTVSENIFTNDTSVK